jgi:hypothetical protein
LKKYLFLNKKNYLCIFKITIINNIYIMIQTVITPGQTNVSFQIPENYIGKKVKITCLPVDDVVEIRKPRKTLADFYGVLSKEEGQSLREHTERARKEWGRSFC